MAAPGDKPAAAKGGKGGKGGKGKDDADKLEELSEEDLALKQALEAHVTRILADPDAGVQVAALQAVISEIRSATASMTSVPKPLKFLAPHYAALRARCDALPAGSQPTQLLADVVSVLASTVAGAPAKEAEKDAAAAGKDSSKEGKDGAKEGAKDGPAAAAAAAAAAAKEPAPAVMPVLVAEREALKYRLLGSSSSLGDWGHEYMRHLAGEIAEEYRLRQEAGESVEDLLALVGQIVPYHMSHNAEPEAVDLLLEVDRLDLLAAHVDKNNYARTCMYLTSCSSYLPPPDDGAVLVLAHELYMAQAKYHDALRVALRVNKPELVTAAFAACTDPQQKKQLAYMLARQGKSLDLEDGPTAVEDEALREAVREAMTNSRLSEHFLALARDLDVMEAKLPEDVFKSHLTDTRTATGANVDSARQNLAATFVNAFVNAGFGTDKLVTSSAGAGEGSADTVHWIFKNKDHGKISATASLGLIALWDVEGSLPQIDKYLYSNDPAVVAGALLAIGVVSAGVQNENDPAFALISEYVGNADVTIRTGAALGLGLAYAGTGRDEVVEVLLPLLQDPSTPMDLAGVAALGVALVTAGSTREDVVMTLLQVLMTRGDVELASPAARQVVLALGLLFLGKQDTVEATIEVAKTLNERVAPLAVVVLDSLAYAGTGNVLKVQELLAKAGEHIDAAAGGGAGGSEEDSSHATLHQGPSVLGLALIAMAEPLGTQMALRALEHLLQYGEAPVRRAVPLAIGLLHVSNPELLAMDTLSRLTHDADTEVAQNAIMALGLLGAGTNNARLAGILRNLASYYYREPTMLYLVRIAQGLAHMSKGLTSINPYHTDRQLLSNMALSGLLVVLFASMDMKSTLAGRQHYLLYCLAPAVRPRMLLTLDEEGKLLPVPVRVGQAVDVVAQAGRPKTITGFQTHTTPVLLGAGERAELATEKYLPLSPVLEGQVILRRNPDYVEVNE